MERSTPTQTERIGPLQWKLCIPASEQYSCVRGSKGGGGLGILCKLAESPVKTCATTIRKTIWSRLIRIKGFFTTHKINRISVHDKKTHWRHWCSSPTKKGKQSVLTLHLDEEVAPARLVGSDGWAWLYICSKLPRKWLRRKIPQPLLLILF